MTGGGRDAVELTSPVDVALPNVARGKEATQSSTARDGVAGRAVDGDTAGDYLRDNTTTHPTRVDLRGAKGRYVRVQLESQTDPMSLTEAAVRGR